MTLIERHRAVRERIGQIPRLRLACIPTPLVEARRLTKTLGGPRIFIKRDDLTGIAMGGNKTRNLEFRLARTMAEGPDAVIVGLDLQSNSARQTVGCCNRLGLRTILVLRGRPPATVQGNLLLDYLLGAEVHFAPDEGSQRQLMAELAAHEREAGRRPHILNDNPMFDVASALAYIECTMEIQEDLQRDGLAATHLYMSSSGKGQAGQILYQRLFDETLAVHGVTSTDEFDDIAARTAAIANRTARTLGLDLEVAPAEVVNFDGYVGAGYGIPSPAAIEAVRLFARTEGVVLDPVYTGKAAAALVDHVSARRLGQGDLVVFVHTGGTPAVFTHHALFETGIGPGAC